ncbi:transglutaminase family protein [Oceanicella sp. SM1341]|uniref:transglutaminase family protein n=1 Tax=Oceanicella sp. SM1341 TaxID=1548889 RepID=UPI000E530519|nr:transglutaminase family protein [Oceanicella sp. SM1341]
MRLSVRHRTTYTYAPEADRVALRLKLFPSTHAGQRVLDWSVSVNGDTVAPLVRDAYGDQVALWSHMAPLDAAEIIASGTVEVTDTTGLVRDLPAHPPPGIFLRDTPLTEPDEALTEFAAAIPPGTELERAHALSAAVTEAVEYRPGLTDAKTTAAQALALGAGVCQDHAHVFIAAARLMGLPARYVVGYLLTDEEAEETLLETHAWAEAFIAGLGWIGFDPSNAVCPTEAYVRLSCGLDAPDAAPVNGNVLGQPEIGFETDVTVMQGQQQQSQSQG